MTTYMLKEVTYLRYYNILWNYPISDRTKRQPLVKGERTTSSDFERSDWCVPMVRLGAFNQLEYGRHPSPPPSMRLTPPHGLTRSRL
uniref:Uncharacterized protein n=1 Tax=Oryza nivara TaxID=4536 RepID=A0A0E0HL46_ORYNI